MARRVFYYPAFVRIEAESLESANALADDYFGDVKPGSASERAGDEDGLIVADGVRVIALGEPVQEDE